MNVRNPVAASVLALAALTAHPAWGQRLPATVVPEHYDLHFTPDFNTNTFAGNETIRVRLTQPSDHITLHAADIQFHDVTIVTDGRPLAATVTLDSPSETATFTVPTPLNAGIHSIRIRYTGVLNDKLRGFYLSQANNRKYAVTQLEATDARRAFPSFDEPALKATFDVSLTLDRRDTAISNGRIISDTPGPGADKHSLKFSTSPKMSTYLVAMAVGDFECLSGAADGIPIRVCATPDKKHLGRFALEAAEFTMSFYNKYFSITYPFEKLDIVAVPDFGPGAMENTGAIFYRERLLLVDEPKVSVDAKRSVASVLAHEIAHHWFGDLVTMKWWDDIWLNEGFATWMENKPVRDLRPAWSADLVEASDTQRALNLDALQATRPIRAKADTPDEISELFDAITYEKGAAVLRMVENMVGPDVFRTGVNNYLKKYAYGNASAEDFWAEIAAASGTPVARIMGSFVDQSGSPLINIRSECKGDRLSVTATQERFSFDATSSSGGAREWQVPVCMKWPGPNGQLEQSCRVFSKPVDTWQAGACSGWVFANAGGMGAYRTAYQPDMLRRIAQAADTSLLPVERISLLGDEWALVRHGGHTVADYLSLAERLARDRVGHVVRMLTGRLDEISEYFVSQDVRPTYEAWIRQLLQPSAQELGWNPPANEPEDQRERRASILYTLGWAGRDAAAIERARETTNQYLDGKATDPTLLSMAIQLAATNGDSRLYDRMLSRMRTDPEPMEQQRFRNALGRFTQPELVRRTIDLVFSEEVKSQDKTTMLGILLANPSARATAWQAIKDRWTDLEGRLGVFGGLPNVVEATAAFCDASSRDDVRLFFETHKVPAAERALRQSLERMDSCIALRNRTVAPLSAFLKSTSTR